MVLFGRYGLSSSHLHKKSHISYKKYPMLQFMKHFFLVQSCYNKLNREKWEIFYLFCRQKTKHFSRFLLNENLKRCHFDIYFDWRFEGMSVESSWDDIFLNKKSPCIDPTLRVRGRHGGMGCNKVRWHNPRRSSPGNTAPLQQGSEGDMSFSFLFYNTLNLWFFF